VLLSKFEAALRGQFDTARAERILAACHDQAALDKMPLDQFLGLFAG
jgi:2-methylcitrate dehydratase